MYKTLAAIAGATVVIGCATASLADGNSTHTSAPTVIHEATPPMIDNAPAPLACSVRATKFRGGLRLEAIVNTGYRTAGTYEFTLEKNGPAGSSEISQGGEFAVEPGRTTVLSGSEISLERGATLAASLTLKTSQGNTACRADF